MNKYIIELFSKSHTPYPTYLAFLPNTSIKGNLYFFNQFSKRVIVFNSKSYANEFLFHFSALNHFNLNPTLNISIKLLE